ncbi:MAG TPA: ATP-binding cassette domain-containing protein [Actinomycetospora sp.]|uniref:ATP-binding cassette domain-containing protein n=1 Tax=Actinomycetospora sp. TaxID=1872135 RepID=UPI002F42106E
MDHPAVAARAVEVGAVEVRGLTKRYGEVEAVRGIDLDVARGETFGFLGPNGAGKSTTINILCTLVEPTSGTAKVAGLDVVADRAAVRRRIGLVFQEPTLDGPMSGEQNLRFHGELYGVDRRTAAARREEVLRTVGLWERRADPVSTYSGGMRRRLEIARGLLHSPQVLFLDEPTIGLDPQTRASIWDYLARLGEAEEITVFVTTHYMDEAENCDRIAIMNEGRIVALDTPEALKAQVGADRVVVATDDDEAALAVIRREFGLEAAVREGAVTVSVPKGAEFVPRLFAALTAEGVGVRSVSVTRPSLDDVFLAHTGTTLRDAEAGRGPSMHPMAMRMRGR